MEAVIEEWGRREYPRLMENSAMIEALYRKKVLNQPSAMAQTTAYPLVKQKDLQPEQPASMIVTKLEGTVQTHDVCGKCNRTKCSEESHKSAGRAALYILAMKAGDETGIETFKRISTDKAQIDVFGLQEEFVVSGVLHIKPQYGREFEIKAAASVTREQLAAWSSLEEFASIHGGAAGISEAEFEQATYGKGALLEPFLQHVFIGHTNGRVKW